MITSRAQRILFATLALAVAPGILAAQQKPAAGGKPAPARAPATQSAQDPQAWIMELQELHGKLQSLQARALQDSQLDAAQAELGGTIKAAMQKIDPELERALGRMQELESQAAAAQQSQDPAKLQQLASEAQQIERRFLSAQQQALQQPALAAKVAAFQELLQKKMGEVDPEAPRLIARFEELQVRLAQLNQGGR